MNLLTFLKVAFLKTVFTEQKARRDPQQSGEQKVYRFDIGRIQHLAEKAGCIDQLAGRAERQKIASLLQYFIIYDKPEQIFDDEQVEEIDADADARTPEQHHDHQSDTHIAECPHEEIAQILNAAP